MNRPVNAMYQTRTVGTRTALHNGWFRIASPARMPRMPANSFHPQLEASIKMATIPKMPPMNQYQPRNWMMNTAVDAGRISSSTPISTAAMPWSKTSHQGANFCSPCTGATPIAMRSLLV